MMKTKLLNAAAMLAAAALLVGTMAGCQKDEATPSVPADTSTTTETPPTDGKVGEEDLDASWDEATATKITLSGDTASIEGGGATASGGTVTITEAGTYVASGTLNGEIVVAANSGDLVRLVLNGASITSTTAAPVYLATGRKLVVVLADGTTNTLADAASYTYYDADKEEPDAALFSKNSLTINGGGSLTVSASFHNGIGAKDDLVLVGGSVTVTAANHGIRGKDSLTVVEGSYTVTAGNDGLQASNSDSAEVGFIDIRGGSFTINAAHDAVQAESSLTITGGSFAITTAGGANATAPAATAEDSTSYKGLKAYGDILISGGSFVLDTLDDAVHADGNVTIHGGSFTIATGDDGMHANEALTITDGDILITQSYEGLEGATVAISGGTIDLKSSDDGINAAGGTDSNGGGRFGFDRFGGSGVSEEYWIDISGGHITIDAGGDGIDSNGSVTMSGGTLLVHGPTSSADGALDYELTFTLTGGTIVAVGASGMAEVPTQAASTQPTLALFYTGTQAAGTTLRLEDENGGTLLEFTANKSFSSAVITCPELREGSSYTLHTGGMATTVALSGMVTSVNETGEAASGGMMGGFGGGMGGARPGGGEMPDRGELPDGMEPPDGMELPDGMEFPGEMPDMGEPPTGGRGRG